MFDEEVCSLDLDAVQLVDGIAVSIPQYVLCPYNKISITRDCQFCAEGMYIYLKLPSYSYLFWKNTAVRNLRAVESIHVQNDLAAPEIYWTPDLS